MNHLTKDQLASISEKIAEVHFGMFTTLDDSGVMSSRPLTSQQVDDKGQLWFFTSDASGFVRHLPGNPSVNVSFSDVHENLYVSVSGRAELVKDQAKAQELWNPGVQVWFPLGLEDPHVSLIRVKIETAEYWDSTASRMRRFISFTKAALTGEPPRNLTEHHKMGH